MKNYRYRIGTNQKYITTTDKYIVEYRELEQLKKLYRGKIN